MTFYSDRETRTARTVHNCWVCGRKIEQGEQYEYQTSYQDGWVTFRTCAHCVVAVQTAFNLRLTDEMWYPEDLRDALAEWSVATARMAVGMTRQWLAFCGYKLLPIPEVIPRVCIERGCNEPVGGSSYTWCDRHDAERIERLNGQFADLAAAFGGVS